MTNSEKKMRGMWVTLVFLVCFLIICNNVEGNLIRYQPIRRGDRIPYCDPKVRSCTPQIPANPYRRGCNTFTRCRRPPQSKNTD